MTAGKFSKILFGTGLAVTDEGGGVITVSGGTGGGALEWEDVGGAGVTPFIPLRSRINVDVTKTADFVDGAGGYFYFSAPVSPNSAGLTWSSSTPGRVGFTNAGLYAISFNGIVRPTGGAGTQASAQLLWYDPGNPVSPTANCSTQFMNLAAGLHWGWSFTEYVNVTAGAYMGIRLFKFTSTSDWDWNNANYSVVRLA